MCIRDRHAVAALSLLREHSVFAGATHRIAAYRAGDGSDFADDDGEARGGGALRGALKKAKATSVVAVCARWYGGVNIGKARFAHIRGRVRSLLRAVGHTEGLSMGEVMWRSAGSGQTLGGSSNVKKISGSPEVRRKMRADLAAAAAERRLKDGVSTLPKSPVVIEILSSSEDEASAQ